MPHIAVSIALHSFEICIYIFKIDAWKSLCNLKISIRSSAKKKVHIFVSSVVLLMRNRKLEAEVVLLERIWEFSPVDFFLFDFVWPLDWKVFADEYTLVFGKPSISWESIPEFDTESPWFEFITGLHWDFSWFLLIMKLSPLSLKIRKNGLLF